ncbi:hypothetical protein KEM60_01463 [Austwickia sp. TVS 96-490-7B]|uniref:hypothetical protein n=1 Tax=Austwickia sp. TVS 96-490-7B TaxID=2830843 RepID=UPI001C5A210B|nr:hypothetical protein [Austwickia sp. TVS 96-490-7B]MBW3085266.1 hypothetical protein [Austwickia sp. TVS 96-490-7B]
MFSYRCAVSILAAGVTGLVMATAAPAGAAPIAGANLGPDASEQSGISRVVNGVPVGAPAESGLILKGNQFPYEDLSFDASVPMPQISFKTASVISPDREIEWPLTVTPQGTIYFVNYLPILGKGKDGSVYGPEQSWLAGTPRTSAVFHGQYSAAYEVRVTARFPDGKYSSTAQYKFATPETPRDVTGKMADSSWVQRRDDKAWAGTNVMTTVNKARVTITADERSSASIDFLGHKGPRGGNATVYVDGKVLGILHSHADHEGYDHLGYTVMNPGKHVIVVEADLAPGQEFSLDDYIINGDSFWNPDL